MNDDNNIWLTGADGNRLAATVLGPADGRVAILLHGGEQARQSWLQTQQRFAEKGFRAVAYDARGHGDSDWIAADRYELNDFAKDLAAVAGQINAHAPVLVGASLGGMTSMLAAGQGLLPNASAIILADVVHRSVTHGADHIRDFMIKAAEGFESLDDAADAIEEFLPDRRGSRDLQKLAQKMRQDGAGRWTWPWDPAFMLRSKEGSGRRFESEELIDAIRAIKVPLLLLRGELSEIVSVALKQEFLSLLPKAHAIDVKGAGHMVAGDDNDAFTKLIFDFVERVVPNSD